MNQPPPAGTDRRRFLLSHVSFHDLHRLWLISAHTAHSPCMHAKTRYIIIVPCCPIYPACVHDPALFSTIVSLPASFSVSSTTVQYEQYVLVCHTGHRGYAPPASWILACAKTGTTLPLKKKQEKIPNNGDDRE